MLPEALPKRKTGERNAPSEKALQRPRFPGCNVVAQITAETILDDGERQEELYAITATCAGRRRSREEQGQLWLCSPA
jgi:hypothetical protein